MGTSLQPRPGDIFLTPIPFSQDIFQSKQRPVVVLKEPQNGICEVAPITGTNKTGIEKGKWILKDSAIGIKMNLKKDSFILMGKVRRLPTFSLIQYWGHCPIVDELLKL
jgi:hypothetical protein